jgi:predicted ATPase/class 3 adenylate cyclase
MGWRSSGPRRGSGMPRFVSSVEPEAPTFLFTDIEGSTRLWEQSTNTMRTVLARHDELASEIVERNGGRIVKSRGEGDSLFAVFDSAAGGVTAACTLQAAFHSEPWAGGWTVKVRMALHTGSAENREGDFYGPHVNRCARLRAIAHGGQVIISRAVCEALSAPLPESVELRDMGHHRLKDLQQPEQVYQVCAAGLPSEFPTLLSLNYVGHNLPVQTTSFVGRDEELAEVRRLLEGARLLTLVGTAGSGKTRLALQAAAERIDQAPDGVWIVDLAPVSDPGLVTQTVAAVLGVRAEPGQPLLRSVCDYLKPKRMLLLLDNCEHVVASCAETADAIVRAAADVQILATSRERIGTPGERLYRVRPLALPPEASRALAAGRDLTALMEFASVNLFCERARLHEPHFALTASNVDAVCGICRTLDGIPLAIELAAARVRALSPANILTRLSDRFRILRDGSRTALPRQQTLEALIDWSYDLLTVQEKCLLHRLTVFAGGWTLEAAEAVCADAPLGPEVGAQAGDAAASSPLEEWQVLDLLASLVDKSLVVFQGEADGGRYRLLETIRQYAAMKRDAADVPVAAERHAAHFLQLARDADPHLRGPEQAAWLQRLEQEHDNLRAALRHCLPDGGAAAPAAAERGLALCGAMAWFWHVRGFPEEGRLWIVRALEANPAANEARADALTGLGLLALQAGDLAAAEQSHAEALKIRRAHGDARGTAVSLTNLGNVAFEAGRYEQARELFAECIAIWEQIGDDGALALAWNGLAIVATMQGNLVEARDLYERGLERVRAAGDSRNIAISLYNLAELSMEAREYLSAEQYLRECLSHLEDIEDPYVRAYAIHTLGMVAHRTERTAAAVRLWGAAEAAFASIGAAIKPGDAESLESAMNGARRELGEERFAQIWREGQGQTLKEAVLAVESLSAAGGGGSIG